MTAGAALLDLPDAAIAVGEPANLALLDLGASWEVGARGYASKSANSCFEGRTLRGVVRLTVAAGAVAHRVEAPVEARGMSAPARTLDRARTALVVIDVQEAFAKAVERFDDVVSQTAILVRGAQALGVPVLVTEQYPRGLGDTVAPVRDALGDVERLPKTVFSAARADGFDLAGPRPGARVRDRDARVREPDGARPARRRGRGARRGRRRLLAHGRQPRAGPAQDGRRAARSSRRSRPPCSSCSARPAATSSRRSRSW